MIIWTPDILPDEQPRAHAIGTAMERDLQSDVLLNGQRLPTQRDQANKLGLNVCTVSRAYSEAALRGLGTSEDRSLVAIARYLPIFKGVRHIPCSARMLPDKTAR